MPDLNDDLIQQLTQAGLYPQQIAQLQRQYQLAQGFMQPQEAQGRQVGGTYVASSPLEHLSNALRPVIGAYMQRSAMNRAGELTGQLSSGRQAFARALQDSSGHPGELMPGGAGDQQRMQQLSMLGAGLGRSGDAARARCTCRSRVRVGRWRCSRTRCATSRRPSDRGATGSASVSSISMR
jgi:hypothetical protein